MSKARKAAAAETPVAKTEVTVQFGEGSFTMHVAKKIVRFVNGEAVVSPELADEITKAFPAATVK